MRAVGCVPKAHRRPDGPTVRVRLPEHRYLVSIYLFTYLSMASWLIAHPNGGADGERERSVTQGSARGARILRAVGITDLDPDSTAAKPTQGGIMTRLKTRVFPFNTFPPSPADMGWQPVVKVPLHSTGAASRLTALLLGHILPVFSLVAPCQPGASPVSVRRWTFTTDC